MPRFVEEPQQHGRLSPQPFGSVRVAGGGQMSRRPQTFRGLGAHDVQHLALAELTPGRLGGTGPDR
jgi:hypothetical protein